MTEINAHFYLRLPNEREFSLKKKNISRNTTFGNVMNEIVNFDNNEIKNDIMIQRKFFKSNIKISVGIFSSRDFDIISNNFDNEIISFIDQEYIKYIDEKKEFSIYAVPCLIATDITISPIEKLVVYNFDSNSYPKDTFKNWISTMDGINNIIITLDNGSETINNSDERSSFIHQIEISKTWIQV